VDKTNYVLWTGGRVKTGADADGDGIGGQKINYVLWTKNAGEGRVFF
jgi:hypothetical protein